MTTESRCPLIKKLAELSNLKKVDYQNWKWATCLRFCPVKHCMEYFERKSKFPNMTLPCPKCQINLNLDIPVEEGYVLKGKLLELEDRYECYSCNFTIYKTTPLPYTKGGRK